MLNRILPTTKIGLLVNLGILSVLGAGLFFRSEKMEGLSAQQSQKLEQMARANLPTIYESSASVIMFAPPLVKESFDTITITRVATTATLPLFACAGSTTGERWSPNLGLLSGYAFTTSTLSTSNNIYGLFTRGSGAGHSRCLELNGFGYNVPAGAQILGIKASIERNGQSTAAVVEDSVIQLTNPASGAVQNKESGFWPTADAVMDYGSSTDLWGATWNSGSINNPSFGLRIKVEFASSGVANIDSVSLSVTYIVSSKVNTASVVSNNTSGACDGVLWEADATAANLSSDNGNILVGYASVVNDNVGNPFLIPGLVDTSACLDLSGFDFNIDPKAVVDSIMVSINRSQTFVGLIGAAGITNDVKISLLKPDGNESNNKAKLALNWPNADATETYGGDNWGVDWTPAMVNDPAFGLRVQVRLQNALLPELARIDFVTIKVFCHFDTLMVSKKLESVSVNKANGVDSFYFSAVVCNTLADQALLNVQFNDQVQVKFGDCVIAGFSQPQFKNLPSTPGGSVNFVDDTLNIATSSTIASFPACYCDTVEYIFYTNSPVWDTSKLNYATVEGLYFPPLSNIPIIVSDSSNVGDCPFTDSVSGTPYCVPLIEAIKYVDTTYRIVTNPDSAIFEAVFKTILINTGNVTLNNVTLSDDLDASAYLGSALLASPQAVVTIAHPLMPAYSPNPAFDGITNDSIFLASSGVSLDPGDSIILCITVRLDAIADDAPDTLCNLSVAAGTDVVYSLTVCDSSAEFSGPGCEEPVCFKLCPTIWYVDSSNTSGVEKGYTWATAFTDLQEALALVAAGCGDTIKVAQGTYYPTTTSSRTISFNIPDSAVLLGGYAPGGSESRDYKCAKTILCGNINGGGAGGNSYHVITTYSVSSTTTVDGFCIRDGNADPGGEISDNRYGGGWFNRGLEGDSSNPTIINCVFTNNRTATPNPIGGNHNGGGMANYADQGTTNPTLINCIFNDNRAQRGGAMYNFAYNGFQSSPKIVNCIFSGNHATARGGAIVNDAGDDGFSATTIVNSVLSGNRAGQAGAAMHIDGSAAAPTFKNSIIWNNNNSVFSTFTNQATISYSIVQASAFGSFIDGGNNKPSGTDPMFVNAPAPGAAPTATGNFHLIKFSPGIDMGDDAAIIAALASYKMVDLDDTTRIINKVDIGPYELQAPDCNSNDYLGVNTVYVDSSAVDGDNDGTSWGDAFTDLQDALLVAKLCGVDSILVAQGTYYPSDTTIYYDACGEVTDILYPDRAISFNVPDSTVVLGGYLTGGSVERDWLCNKTLLCGDIDQDGTVSGNSYHVLYTAGVDSATVIDGFCISGGYADGPGQANQSGGGWFNGIAGDTTSPILRNCFIYANYALERGGGVFLFGRDGEANPQIINCKIFENESGLRGGGIFALGDQNGNASPFILNTIISGNEAGSNGGGIFFGGEMNGNITALVVNSIISGNRSDNRGGGIYNRGQDGGNASPVFINTTIAGNRADEDGGAVYNDVNPDGGVCAPDFKNCIFWNNEAGDAGQVFYNNNVTATPSANNSIFQGGPDINNLSITEGSPSSDNGANKFETDGIDPLFVNSPPPGDAPTTEGDFHVSLFSPAIDMGDDGANSQATDLDGNDRFINTIDIGPYESLVPDCDLYVGVTTIYVDSSAVKGGDGKTWGSAFTDLQDALLVVRICSADTIKVAQGTYYPAGSDTTYDKCDPEIFTVIPADRRVSFNILDSTVLLGGYEIGGSETSDGKCNPTILCGDIQQDGLDTNNSYHVVTTFGVSDQTVVDGFCIRGGFAVYSGSDPFPTLRNAGGGWLNSALSLGAQDDFVPLSSNPRILNCTFTDNHGLIGAGLANLGIFGFASPYIEGCNFNADSSILGGGIANIGYDGESSPTILNSKIQGNTGVAAGGILNLAGSLAPSGLAPTKGNLRSKSSIPKDLSEAFEKSGLMNLISVMSNHMPKTGPEGTLGLPAIIPGFGVSNPVITNTLITGNSALAGGGMVNYVLNLAFIGGGECSPRIVNSTVANNWSFLGGGMINGDEGPVNDGNNIIKPCIVNTIIYGNASLADPFTQDMFIILNGANDDTIKIHHSMLGSSDYASLLTGQNNCTNCVDTTLGGNKYNIDPIFRDAGYIAPFIANPSGDFHVDLASPAINMGDNAAITASLTGHDFTDLDGLPRIAFVTVDIGAYESILNCDTDTIYVNADGSVDPLPLDSILGAVLTDAACSLLVDGVLTTGPIPFDCDDRGENPLQIDLVKEKCDVPVTLYSCIKVVVVLDTFDKRLTAHDQVNVSLDDMCMEVITAHDVLVNFKGCNTDFEVTLTYPNGTNTYSPANKLDRSHLGYCMTFTVTDKLTGNKTWGKLCVEDKKGPDLACQADTVTCFEIAQLPQGSYTVKDNCASSETKVLVASEQFIDYGCDSFYQGKVIRHLVASDPWGNSVECEKEFYIKRIELDSVVCPRDTGIDCSLETGTSFKDPSRSGYPKIKTKNGLISLWPNNAACKLTLSPPIDEWYPICGAGYKIRRTWRITDWCTGEEKLCYQWIEVVDKTAPVASNKTLPIVYSDPHDCGQFVDIDTLAVSDCSKVTQNYSITYFQEGIPKVIQGVLPAKHIWLPVGVDTVKVFLVDACKNTSKARILIPVIDNTPPTPICDEFTQVTVDPASCWAAIAAKDLDNGSRDNCCDVLHFAAAHMDSITFWRNHWTTTLEAEVGKEAFWKSKPLYDTLIEDWINCYVFSDTVNFDDCGSNQVVMRVYEACGIPKYDPHVFPCSPHAWFCYNTYIYLAEFNYNWFDANGAKSCKYRPTLTSLEKMELRYASYYSKGYLEPKFAGAAQLDYCNVPFYFPSLLTGTNYSNPPGSYCSDRLYSDCMVNVLVDDKQAPVAYGLKDITIYCDGAPEWSRYKYCGDDADHYRSSTWPGELKDKKGVIHGYYGGSDFLGVHVNEDDHADPQACRESHGWAPIYCKDWLLLDSFDQAGHQDYASYFDKLLMFDKKTKQTAELKDNEFSITDNCLLDKTSLLVSNAGTINGCGEGWISRTWTMKDKCGNEVTATQKIYVKHRSDFEVIFPADKVVTCDFLNRTDTSALGAGKPSISDDECEQVGVQYKDEVFTVEDSACYKIVRTWTLIDWCIYDPNQHNHHPDVIVDDRLRANSTNRSCVFRNIKDNGDGYMQYVQVIKVIDEIAPVFTCSDNTTCITAGCDATVNLPVSASDNCTDANDIRIRAEITKPDATVESRTNITAITGTFTEGVYKVKLVANDKCGNETTCNMTITVKDCKKPTPYCIDGLATVIMPNNGTVEIWAKDFNVASEDNCTAKDALRYSFGPDATNPNRVITCADIRNGREELLVVDIYVHDLADNKDLCKVSLKIQDNSSAEYPSGGCRDTTSALATITGKLATEEQEGVENARVEIRSSLSPLVNYMSKQDGSYTFKEMPMVGTYTLHALRDDEPMNGVSTLDLVAIQKHILGTEKLKSAYKMIAADVNNDKDISAIDLIELRKLILGVYEKLPGNTSWKFVPKSYVFNDINNPWSYPTQEVLTEMNDQMVKDFVGIKVGDVNASAVPHSLMGTEVRSTETGLIFEVEDKIFRKGEAVKVEFKSPNFAGVSGFQGTMSMYNVPYTMYNVEAGALSMTEKNIGKRWINEGIITMSWNDKTGIDIESDKVLFTLTFKAEKDGKLSDVMRIGSQRTKAESYEGKGELGNLSIRFIGKNGKEVSGTNMLYQNYPNPFDQRTVIGINLAQGGRGTLKIVDVSGRVVKSFTRDWVKGYQEIILSKTELSSTGILYYQFESEFYTANKRMIITE